MVEKSLSKPYTPIVLSILIAILGALSVSRMATDIFPQIDVPVVSVIWTYTGMPPVEMERRIVTISERAFTTTVNDIEHMESQSMSGIAVIKVYFQPGSRTEAAVAQLSASAQTVLKSLPPGITPPLILKYSASDVPILQLVSSSTSLSEQELYDYSLNFIRTQLATVQGASVPSPFGGKVRQVMVDLNMPALNSYDLTPMDVVSAVNAQNLILPSGTVKIGKREFNVKLNSSPELVELMNDIPVGNFHRGVVTLRDVGQVRDGYAVQTNIVRENSRRGALLTVMKSGGASTLDVVSRVQEAIPRIQSTVPSSLRIDRLFDQSVFVRAAVSGVVREAGLAALLTALMILAFLGSLRSTLIVAVSIPLSMLGALFVMDYMGQTLNVMTLGGLALAVGMLVDNATVVIENIHRELEEGRSKFQAVLEGTLQVGPPMLVATLAIMIVFVPILLLTGVSRSLFTPMAISVVVSMAISFLLSRTLTPVMANYLLKESHGAKSVFSMNVFEKFHFGFEHRFSGLRIKYKELLTAAAGSRRAVMIVFGVYWLSAVVLLPFVGQDFFPAVDAGQIRLHVRAPAGTRIEETERDFEKVEAQIRQIIPPSELDIIVDKIGLPISGSSLAFIDPSTVGTSDGEILISLKEGHASTWTYMKQLRTKLKESFPDLSFFFQPADIVSQILNFGMPAPVDVQITGRNMEENYLLTRKILSAMTKIPGAVDVHLHQVWNAPEITLNVDRARANSSGLTQRDIANNLLVTLSSSGVVAPNFWLNMKNGVSYPVAVQAPQYRVDSVDQIQMIPVASPGHSSSQVIANLGTIGHNAEPAVVSHYNVQPVFDIFAAPEGRDLGALASDISSMIDSFKNQTPRGSFIAMRGQVETMNTSYRLLLGGMAFAVFLVYMLLVINFQSWLDAFIILAALPSALGGIVWTLFSTSTTFSVPALLGSIMTIGVGTANSILLVTFARNLMDGGVSSVEAAVESGFVRFRPVLMTALAMVLGMVPMALGLGEGGEQNAPLGRAVIGGLISGTVGTLFVVPIAFASLAKKKKAEAI